MLFNSQKKRLLVFLMIASLFITGIFLSERFIQERTSFEGQAATGTTFTNPLFEAADPWIIQKDGWYYFTKTMGSEIYVRKAKTITGIGEGTRVTVYKPTSGPASKNIWAPELHFLNGKWYIYFAANDGNNANHRIYVLEATTSDPQGPYILKGKIADVNADYQAIDATVLQYNNQLYLLWAGVEPYALGGIYIAKMSNPWTLSSSRVKLTQPEYAWEKIGWEQVEAPQPIIRNGKLFIVYSASSQSSADYCLGLLTFTGSDVMNKASWAKKSTPIFKRTSTVFAPGHNSFTKSPDGTEDWFLFHARSTADASTPRMLHAQKFTWNTDGSPNLGTPITQGVAITRPSGEITTTTPPVTPSSTITQTGGDLQGKVFVDTNNNSVYTSGEPVVSGVTVTVYKRSSSGLYDIRCCSTSTDTLGNYRIADRTPGAYELTLSVPTGYQAVSSNPALTTISSGDKTVNFALKFTTSVTPTRTPTPPLRVTPTTVLSPSTAQPTPTRVASPTVTLIPSPTNTEIPASLRFTIYLHGIGNAGDNANPGSLGNMNPLDTQREATISFMTNTGETNDVSLPLSYNSDSGNFRGDLNDYLLPKGSYILRIKVPGFLVKQIPGFITVQNTSLITPQSAYLTTGDIIANNALDILDYNSILDCYAALGPASNCEDPAKQKASDITNDGIVDQLDYNLFLRELSVQSGQ